MAIRTPLVREEIMIPFIVQDLNVSEDILSHVLDDKLLGLVLSLLLAILCK